MNRFSGLRDVTCGTRSGRSGVLRRFFSFRQRREVIPKCSVHINQELLFCETCDTVFCTLCTGGSHSEGTASGEHTIIPFSIAIKRMSEILLYKANECISKVSGCVGFCLSRFSYFFLHIYIFTYLHISLSKFARIRFIVVIFVKLI